MAPKGREKVGDRTHDPAETRYGCFLTDLTGLASKPSAAGLPVKLYQVAGVDLQALKTDNGLVLSLSKDGGAAMLRQALHEDAFYCSTTKAPIMPWRAPRLKGEL